MARTYTDLIGLVRSWSNRDTEVLPNERIVDFVRYAADKAYRQLRIAPLEHTLIYTNDGNNLSNATSTTTSNLASVTELIVPTDLIEFIQIRGVDSQGRTTRMFNEKADVRTFNDMYAEKYNDFAVWTRQGNNLLLAPGFGQINNECGYELYYYRRLPSLHARFIPNKANYDLGLTTSTQPTNLIAPEEAPANTEAFVGNDEMNIAANTVYGLPVPNWLRDENERVILMGALAEAFFYLQENEEAQKYGALFTAEINELNKEDQMRNASGGNVQINFNGRGLI